MGSVPQQVRVCVIGAGVAGLGAAQKLIETGIKDIVVLEAQDRVGGRVHTVPHDDYHLEFGAHWIHGEEGNAVYEWASENGKVEDNMSLTQTGLGETLFVRHTGEIVPTATVDEFRLVRDGIEEEEQSLASYPKSFGEFFMERFREKNRWGTLGEELADWQGRFQNCIDGTDSWFQASAKGHTMYVECRGNPVVNWKPGGYQNLLDHLKKSLSSSQLLLKTPVKSIDWNVSTSDSNKKCCIHLKSGETIQASHVVFTPSLAVLKECARELFNPVLPAEKLKAIQGLGIGCVDKIYFKFPYQWWPEDCDGFSLLRDLDHTPTTITTENWESGIVGFYEVVKQPNMLCTWICGEEARQMEKTPIEEVSQRCVAVLRKFLGSRFDIPNTIWCARSTWYSNPWTRGSYSFRSMDTEKLGVSAADLAKPLVDPVSSHPLVCFAGEATHDCYYSTVHGALESGWREAKRIADYIQSSQGSSPMNRISKRRSKYQVVIVGCGAAGIGAAKELTSKGIHSVLILEGSDRVGGRVNTIGTSNNSHVDLGAQWVHGEVGNAIFNFANSKGLLYDHTSLDGEGDFYSENGELIPQDVVKEVFAFMDRSDDDLHVFSDAPLQLSVGDFFKDRFSQYLISCNLDAAEMIRLKKALYAWYVRWLRVDNACNDLHELSAHCWGRYIFCDGKENMNPRNGYSSILEALLREINVEISLNSEVVCIDYAKTLKRKGYSYVREDGTTMPVIISCRDGREYEAEHVVVTPSIGYLKGHLNMFSPPLPNKLSKAITTTGFGTIDKIFLEFEEPFWSANCDGIQIVWKNQVPIFEKLPSLDLDARKEEMKKIWFHGITGFEPVPHQKAMLVGWIGGAEAEYAETISENELGQACVYVLRKFLGRNDIPYPKKVYRSQWATNKFFCGSYSHHSVPCDCRMEGNEKNSLNTPVSATTESGEEIPVMVLAGEANSISFYSTVHGAYQNGMSQVSHYLDALPRWNTPVHKLKSKI